MSDYGGDNAVLLGYCCENVDLKVMILMKLFVMRRKKINHIIKRKLGRRRRSSVLSLRLPPPLPPPVASPHA